MCEQGDSEAQAYIFIIGPDCNGDYADDRHVAPDPPCQTNCNIADFNLNHVVTVQDLFDFLGAYFGDCLVASNPPSAPCYQSADVNSSGAISVQDVFDYLSHWFTCQN